MSKFSVNRAFTLLSMLVIVSMLLVACGGGAAPADVEAAESGGEEAAAAEPAAEEEAEASGEESAAEAESSDAAGDKYGGRLVTVLSATIDKLDPQVAISFQEWNIVTNITHNGLMKYDFNDELVPDLAEKYEMNEAGDEFIFTLNKGRKFSNGREVVADDIKYSLTRAMKPETGSWGNLMLMNVVGAPAVIAGDADEAEGIEVIDDYTIKFSLIEPQSTFVSFLAASPIFINPKEEVEKWGDEYPLHAVGTGPFMIKEFNPGTNLVLEKNPYYYELPERPYLDEIEFVMNIDEQTTLLMIESGDADITADLMPPSVMQQVLNDPDWEDYIYNRPGFSPVFMWMNSENEPFDDVRVRQAVLYAINRDKLDKMLTGVGVQIRGLYVPGAPGYDPDFDPYPYNPEKAKELLAEAGFPDGFDTKLYWHDEVASWTLFPVPIQQDLAEVGINAELIKVSVPAKNELAAEKAMPIGVGGWGPATVDCADWYSAIFLCANKDEPTGYPSYCNPVIDEMFAETQKTFDEEKRAALFREMEDILMADAPMISLMNMSYYVLLNPKVKGYTAHILTPPINPFVWIEE